MAYLYVLGHHSFVAGSPFFCLYMLKSSWEMQLRKATPECLSAMQAPPINIQYSPPFTFSVRSSWTSLYQKSSTLGLCFTFLQVLTTYNLRYLVHIQSCLSLFLRRQHGVLFLRYGFVYSCCTELSLTQRTHSVKSCQLKESFLKIIS